MTLVLSMGNVDQVVQISDRRLTDSSGKPCVLPECKSTILTLDDSRLLVGFAGLARAGRFRTGRWILEAMGEAAAKDHLALGTVERFTTIASNRWQKADLRSVPREHRGLSVLFTGYNDTRPSPNLISAIVTNFQNFETGQDEEPWDEFKTTWGIKDGVPAEEATYIQRIGAWVAMDDVGDSARLRRMLEERRPAEKIINGAVGIVREIAARPAACGLIGTELNSAVLPAPRVNVSMQDGIALQLGFHPDGASHALHGPNQVISTSEAQLLIADPTMGAAEPEKTPPVAVQKVGRNKPCPCGSGKKFKRCHGG